MMYYWNMIVYKKDMNCKMIFQVHSKDKGGMDYVRN